MQMYTDDLGNNPQRKVAYCLRWNNHRSNLLSSFSELLQNGEFIDVTLACDGGVLKCHKMVLAACSTYFQTLFTELPGSHTIVVLKDVKLSEIKAILEYMYRGEVNVAQDQLAALLKIAETLQVKGLVEENRNNLDSKSDIQRSSDNNVHQQPTTTEHVSPPTITTSTNNLQSAQSSCLSSTDSPPHSTVLGLSDYNKHQYNIYGKSPGPERNSRMSLPMWPVAGIPHPTTTVTPPQRAAMAAILNNCYDSSTPEQKEIKREMCNRDTPILRTVLGQGQADSSQPVSLVCHPDSRDSSSVHSNSSFKFSFKYPPANENLKIQQKIESEEAQSPYSDEMSYSMEEKSKLAHLLPPTFPSGDIRGMSSSSIANYVPTQKPEWKRYKQYTRNDISSAIEAVRSGMSALQASKKYGVPSRTLYDKVKKLGITTSRPSKRSSGNGSPVRYKWESDLQHTQNGSPSQAGYSYGLKNEDPGGHHATSLMEATFLQHALSFQARSNGGPVGLRSIELRSPSPNALNYMRQNSLTPSPSENNIEHHTMHRSENDTNGSFDEEDDIEDDVNHVEDLSIQKKSSDHLEMPHNNPPEVSSPTQINQPRVIVSPSPPINQISTIVNKKEELKDILRENRREVHVDEGKF